MNIVCAAVWRSISRQLSAVRWVRSARQCHHDNCCKSNLTYILICECDYNQQIEAVTHHDTSLSSAVSEARSVGHSLTTPKCNTALVTCAGSVLKLNWRPLCQTNHNFLAVFFIVFVVVMFGVCSYKIVLLFMVTSKTQTESKCHFCPVLKKKPTFCRTLFFKIPQILPSFWFYVSLFCVK